MPSTCCLRHGSTILLVLLSRRCSLPSCAFRNFTCRTAGAFCRRLTSTLPRSSTLEMLSLLLRCSNKAHKYSTPTTLTLTVLRALPEESLKTSLCKVELNRPRMTSVTTTTCKGGSTISSSQTVCRIPCDRQSPGHLRPNVELSRWPALLYGQSVHQAH